MLKWKTFRIFRSRPAMLFFGGALLLFAGALLAAAEARAQEAATIEVEGEGEVLAKPDIAHLTLAVETQAPQVEEARAVNARASEALLKAVKGMLKDDEKIQSVSYQVYPVYQQREKSQAGQKVKTTEVAGYKASHFFRVELRDLSRIGQIADAALKSGASRVQGPYFDHSQKDKLQQQAAVLALKRARELAEALAQSAGLKVMRLKKLSTAAAPRPVRMARAELSMAPGEAAPETPVEVGEEKFQARLTAIFEVGP
ncbi:MAG: SIMPL domain-containing protein [Deltaproteobacteria bacterium]|nr:SIMPL domain-containing protein [Deltaproteobacteria bacterium]